MSILPKPVAALKPKTDASKQIAILYAVLLVVMSVAQLFTFEDFIKLVPTFNLPISLPLQYAVAPLLVASEVFAIPFLLRMYLSPAFRWFSMFLGWLAAVLWVLISFWVVSTGQPVPTIGFMGTVVNLAPGWWAVFISLAFGILAAWASWGMWPPAVKVSKTKK